MKIFLTGANGQLGRELQKRLTGTDFMATDLPEMDITDVETVSAMIGDYKPDVVIHCAAYTRSMRRRRKWTWLGGLTQSACKMSPWRVAQ